MSLFMNDFDDDENPTKFRGIDVRGGKKGIDAANNNYIATLTAGALKYMEKCFQVSSDIINPFAHTNALMRHHVVTNNWR